MQKTITSLSELKRFLEQVPEGWTVNILSQDLLAGNFDDAHFEAPDGTPLDVHYTGEVEEGYVSPFEMAHSESDL